MSRAARKPNGNKLQYDNMTISVFTTFFLNVKDIRDFHIQNITVFLLHMRTKYT